MTARPLQTLLTGFGPFGKVTNNPSARLVRHFAANGANGHELTCLTLPVSYACAPDLMQNAIASGGTNGQPFDLVLMLGVAAGAAKWRLERLGRNRNDDYPDAEGFNPGGLVIDRAVGSSLPSTLPSSRLVGAIANAGLPAIPSDNAGGYLCNHLLFTTLRYLRRTAHPARAIFLHVPADETTFTADVTDKPTFPFEQHIEAVCAVLNALASPPFLHPPLV